MPKTPSPAARPSATNHPDVSDVAQLGYEQARDELVAVVARLEAGGASLEESLNLWERGEALAARCQDWLDGARERLASARSQDAAPTDQPAVGDDPAHGSTPEA